MTMVDEGTRCERCGTDVCQEVRRMNLTTARAIRERVVGFGTRKNMERMTGEELEQYRRARASSRDVVRALNNERTDVIAPLVGGIENVAKDYEIDEGAARILSECMETVRTISARTMCREVYGTSVVRCGP